MKTATLSDDGLYRYELRRRWSDEPPMTWVMLNPSTADAEQDDPTIRRCMGFAKREGCGEIVVVNLFALRVTRPAHLFDGSIGEPNGPDNYIAVLDALVDARSQGAPIVVAWGACMKRFRSKTYQGLAGGTIRGLYCLGTTADGSPRHPLYVKADQPLEVWP